MYKYKSKYRKNPNKKKCKVNKCVRKYVTSAIRNQIEDKYLQDDQMIVTAISNNATTLLQNGLSVGADVQQRVGQKIRMTSIEGNFVIATAGASIAGTTSTHQCRIMLIYDKQPNGAGITLNQLFVLSGAGNTFLSPLNPAGKPRYEVLIDRHYNMPINGGAANVSENRIIRLYKKLNKSTKYNTGNTGLIGDINTGSLYWLLCSDTGDLVYVFSGILRFEDA